MLRRRLRRSRKATRGRRAASSRVARGWRMTSRSAAARRGPGRAPQACGRRPNRRAAARRRTAAARASGVARIEQAARCSTSTIRARRPALHRRVRSVRGRPPDRAGASPPRSRSRPRASANRRRGRSTSIGLPIEMSTTPGRSTKLLRGQQRADVTATGSTGRPVSMASRVPPCLVGALAAARRARAFGKHDHPVALRHEACGPARRPCSRPRCACCGRCGSGPSAPSPSRRTGCRAARA